MAYGVDSRIGPYGIFNGTTSKIDTQSDWIGVGACTISAWIYATGWGEVGYGRIIDNGKFRIHLSTDGRVYLDSNYPSTPGICYTNSSAIVLGKWTHIVATRNSIGTGAFYINGVYNTQAINSGTPTAGSTDVIIGNNNASSTTFDGNIALFEVRDLVLTADEVAALYNRRLYR